MRNLLLTTAIAVIIVASPAMAQTADTTTTPVQMLPPSVVGSAAACPAGSYEILAYSGNTLQGQGSGINCVPITTDASGDLAASGFVKAGNSNLACNAGTAGAIRFNAANGQFEGCNGSTWGSLVPPSPSSPSGTLCGHSVGGATMGRAYCQGSDPAWGCPAGYYQTYWLIDIEAYSTYEFTCVKN